MPRHRYNVNGQPVGQKPPLRSSWNVYSEHNPFSRLPLTVSFVDYNNSGAQDYHMEWNPRTGEFMFAEGTEYSQQVQWVFEQYRTAMRDEAAKYMEDYPAEFKRKGEEAVKALQRALDSLKDKGNGERYVYNEMMAFAKDRLSASMDSSGSMLYHDVHEEEAKEESES